MNLDAFESNPTTAVESESDIHPESVPSRIADSGADTAADEARLRQIEATYAERLAEQTRKSAEWERACKAAILDRELATALAGRPLMPGAAAQLLKLWHDDFDVLGEADSSRVVARDGRPLAQVVAERLSRSEYAHFCQPTSRGGTATNGSGRLAGSGPDPTPPRNLGEIALRRWLEAATRMGGSVLPVGLSRRRR